MTEQLFDRAKSDEFAGRMAETSLLQMPARIAGICKASWLFSALND